MAINLSEFLKPLKTPNVQVVIKDLNGDTVCKIFADSVSALDDSLENRTVNRWDIIRDNSLLVYLNDEKDVPSDIPVTSISLNTDTLLLSVGETSVLTVTIEPNNATDKSIIWSSSDDSIATVADDGTVTANAEGSATISVVTVNGSQAASCVVNVTV